MKIRIIPGYEHYGIDENNKMFSLRKGEWYPLKDTGDARQRLCLHCGTDTTTVTRAKFIFCATKQINPRKMSALRLYVDSSYNVVDKATINIKRTKDNIERLKKRKNEEVEEHLNRTIFLAQCCLKAMRGEFDTLLYEIENQRGYITTILKRTGANDLFVDNAFTEASEQLIEALSRGAVSNPINWLIKRGRGIIADYRKKYVRLSECN